MSILHSLLAWQSQDDSDTTLVNIQSETLNLRTYVCLIFVTMLFCFSSLVFALIISLSPSLTIAAPRSPRAPSRLQGKYTTLPTPSLHHPNFQQVTHNVLELTASDGLTPSHPHLIRLINPLHKRSPTPQNPISTLPLTTFGGRVYHASISFGSTNYTVVIDTGSSDTWLIQDAFQCQAVGYDPPVNISEDQCGFGLPYVPSAAFRTIQDQAFNINYADGEKLSGSFGVEQMGVGGGLVFSQAIGVVDTASWIGDGRSSGLVGLGLSHPNFRYVGTGPRESTDQYGPFFTSL